MEMTKNETAVYNAINDGIPEIEQPIKWNDIPIIDLNALSEKSGVRDYDLGYAVGTLMTKGLL